MEKKVIVTVGEALDASLESFRRRFDAKESRSLRLRDGSLAASARIHEIVYADRVPAPDAVWYEGRLIPTGEKENLAEALFCARSATGLTRVSIWDVNNS